MAKTKKADSQKSATRSSKVVAEGTPTEGKHPVRPAAHEAVVPLNRRGAGERRKAPDRRKTTQPVVIERRKIERRTKVARRRQIDPTTCERDYTAEEIEFMGALDAYKRSSGRMFPTCSEILEVVRRLGYEKRPSEAAESQPILPPPVEQALPSQSPSQFVVAATAQR